MIILFVVLDHKVYEKKFQYSVNVSSSGKQRDLPLSLSNFQLYVHAQFQHILSTFGLYDSRLLCMLVWNVAVCTWSTCLVLDGGEVISWGRSDYGQLGLGDDVVSQGYCYVPQKIPHFKRPLQVPQNHHVTRWHILAACNGWDISIMQWVPYEDHHVLGTIEPSSSR